MSKWDKYKASEVATNPTNRWDKYKITSIQSSPGVQGDSWPKLIGKSVGKGITSLVDIPKLAAEGTESIYNMGAKMRGAPVGMYGMGLKGTSKTARPNIAIDENAPQTNYASYVPSSEDARRNIENYTGINLEPKPTSSAQRVVSHAADFAGSSLGLGLGTVGKGANLLNRFKKASDFAKTGAVVGGVSGAAQEAGINPLVADIGASVATPSNAVRRTYNTIRHPIQAYENLERNLIGLSPDKIKLDVARAARNSNIDLPASALTDSKLTAFADQLVSKTPYFGDKLKKKYEVANNQLKDRLENIYESVGPKKTDEVENLIASKYANAENALPAEASVVPHNTLDTIKFIEKIQKNTLSPSPREKELFAEAENLKKSLSPEVVGSLKIPADVNQLLGTKKSFNSTIKWNEDAGVKNLLKKLQGSLSEDIGAYGSKSNPKWHKKFQEAEKYYADVAKRKKLEEFMSSKGINYANDSVNHAALSKLIHSPKNELAFKNLVDNKTFQNIADVGKVSQAMAQKGVNNPNPSGTAPTAAVGSFIVSFVADPTKVITPMVTLLGTARATKLLTDKKFIDNAVKFAENPNNLFIGTSLNERIKKITGYSAISLNRELSKRLNEEQRDGLQ